MCTHHSKAVLQRTLQYIETDNQNLRLTKMNLRNSLITISRMDQEEIQEEKYQDLTVLHFIVIILPMEVVHLVRSL